MSEYVIRNVKLKATIFAELLEDVIICDGIREVNFTLVRHHQHPACAAQEEWDGSKEPGEQRKGLSSTDHPAQV